MPKITFIGNLAIEHEALLSNVAHARSLGLPYFRESEPHGRRLAVVGGGPSIVDKLDEIREFSDVWAINGACGFLREHGLDSTVFSLDPFPIVAPRIAGAKKALLCTRCDPSVFETLKGADIELFDVMHEAPGGIWASCSTVLATFHLATLRGYRQTVFYGCEGSFGEGSTHAYMNEVDLQDYRFVVECGGKQYLTSPDLYMQTQQMAVFFRGAINDSFTERSGGLLRAFIDNEEHDIVRVSPALMAGLEPITA
jgi:hypothetical protein